MAKDARNRQRIRRHLRVRKKVAGTKDRPRLNVFRSLNQIYAQIIDDDIGHTMVSVSSLDAALSSTLKGKSKTDQARTIGEEIAKRAQKQGVKLVVFDRGGYRYHGRVRALAEAAREGGLEF
ncbi:MAG: 50S ribosomal protein L18 [Anaerolineales bacterium]|nr:MAG: 50S ribosomal protein L18 [Anaerolineales bacterium]